MNPQANDNEESKKYQHIASIVAELVQKDSMSKSEIIEYLVKCGHNKELAEKVTPIVWKQIKTSKRLKGIVIIVSGIALAIFGLCFLYVTSLISEVSNTSVYGYGSIAMGVMVVIYGIATVIFGSEPDDCGGENGGVKFLDSIK